eukprot:466105_1
MKTLYMYALIIVFGDCLSKWIRPVTPVLPRETWGFAIGAYENRIIMMGGWPINSATQLFQYDITTNIFIDNGTSALSQRIANGGTLYTQSGNILYMMAPHNPEMHTYNLESNVFTTSVTTPPIVSDESQCLASTDNYIFITGGSNIDYLNKVQIMDISTKTWSLVPNMNEKRAAHSCEVDPTTNILYVIG